MVHYYNGFKNAHHGQAFLKGFKARSVESNDKRLVPGALHIIGGLQFGSLELLMRVRAAGEPYIFFDRAYFGGGPKSNVLRVVPTAYQHWWANTRNAERVTGNGEGVSRVTRYALPVTPSILPWRTSGEHVLVVPPSEAIERLFGLRGWLDDTIARLRSATRRRLWISFKQDRDQAPLVQRLQNCWAVVTWTSNVAVEAACAGIPVFVHTESAAAPVGNWLANLEERIERPRMPEGREKWVQGLMDGQFTVDEIASGYAAQRVLPHFSGEE